MSRYDAAKARAAAKRDAAKARAAAKRDAAKARAAAKRDAAKATAAAKRDAAKARAVAKRAADQAIIRATKAYKARQDAVQNDRYVTVSALGTIPQTVGSFKHSRWAVVADVCVRCERPRMGCMCVL